LLDETGDKYWVFDTLSKKPLVTRLFTQMSGSVVTKAGADGVVEPKKGKGSSRGGRGAGKENAEPKRKAKAKPAAKRRTAPQPAREAPVLSLSNVPAEEHVGDTVVHCNIGVRPKLWVDDLLACVAHVVSSVKAMGLQHEVDFTVIKSDLIRIGLCFAFHGEIVLHDGSKTTQHRRWSRLRPALKQYALHKIMQARWTPQRAS